MKTDERLEIKIDEIKETIGAINVTLAAQHVSLKEHMRRTELLEAKVEPIEKHVGMINGAFKLLSLIAASIGVAATIAEIVSTFKK